MFSPRALTVILFAWVSLSLGAAGDSPRITRVVPDAARPLPLSAVRLTGGPLKHAQDLDAKYLVSLESDRMLAYYRQRAGLAPKAPPLKARARRTAWAASS